MMTVANEQFIIAELNKSSPTPKTFHRVTEEQVRAFLIKEADVYRARFSARFFVLFMINGTWQTAALLC